ncbi:hypothetical protein [Nonomuraea phyllanthi]|uniref:hypothetical protein n=1 Tax=Nonomuraea phyllanthi TaxID=2219224 RepID=UPI001D00ECE7|nr:hypothetical protein [Nonomuraea phyllanthi]
MSAFIPAFILALDVTAPGLVALSAVVTALAIWLIIAAARLTRRPRNRPGIRVELVDQVRELKALGQIQEAVFLVRGETGMSQHAAARFVNRL